MYTLSPSIFASDYMNIESQLRTMEKQNVKRLHVDVMDGEFVPNISFGPDFVRSLRKNTDMELDVHLMISDPIRFVDDFAQAGADIITVHFEACGRIEPVLERIRENGKRAGIVLKPETGLEQLSEKIWENISVLQIMTVQPGMRGQRFNRETLTKIRDTAGHIKEHGLDVEIEVDGDINTEHLKEVLEAGARIVVVGKSLFEGSLSSNITKYLAAGAALT